MYLRVHSWFSLGYGVCSPEQILSKAAECGWDTLVLTDINSTAGVAEWMRLAPRYGIRPLVGLDCRSGTRRDYVLIARNQAGYAEICRRLTRHFRDGGDWPVPAELHPDLWVIYEASRWPGHRLRQGEWIGLSHRDLWNFQGWSLRAGQDRLLAMETASWVSPRDRSMHRILRAVHHNILYSALQSCHDLADSDHTMEKSETVFGLFESYPELLFRSVSLLDACRMSWEMGSQYPHKNLSRYTGNEDLDFRFMCYLSRLGIASRYRTGPPPDLESRLLKEWSVIRQKRYVSYFLINWKILKFARESGFFYVGRGSGANSLVAYLLFITDVDPLELDLYFERFINLYRRNPPDFDLDFSWQDRDCVLNFVFRRFPHVALLGTHVCYQHRSAVRELSKVFGLPADETEALCTMRGPDKQPADRLGRMILHYAARMQDMPSHHSIHAGGVLITEDAVEQCTACFFPPKGFPTALMDMHAAEDLGFHKFDLLSQRGLAKIKDTLEALEPGRRAAVGRILRDIPRLKRNARIAGLLFGSHSVGCFYIESPAMRMLLTKLKVRDYLALVAASSVIRPGVSSSGMMRVYIERVRCPDKRGEAPSALKDLLPETHGVMVYQEDVIRVAHFFGGLSLAEADVLRRSMSGKHRGRTELQDLKKTFMERSTGLGHDLALVQEVWRQIEGFAGYAFAKGHSASYAVESYQCLYLKAYEPLSYMVSVLNNGGGFYSTEEYIQEARRWGGEVLGPCVNRSERLFVRDGSRIWVGLHWISGFERGGIDRLLETRVRDGWFVSVEDCCRRAVLSLEQALLLWRVGAFGTLSESRTGALWSLRLYYSSQSALREGAMFREEPLRPWPLPALQHEAPDYVLRRDVLRQAYDQIDLLGFPISDPFVLVDPGDEGPLRPMPREGIEVGDVLLLDVYAVHLRSVRTVRGERMAFGTWRDASGTWVDTVHFPPQLLAHPWKGKGVYRLVGRLCQEYDYRFVEVQSMHKHPYIPSEPSDLGAAAGAAAAGAAAATLTPSAA